MDPTTADPFPPGAARRTLFRRPVVGGAEILPGRLRRELDRNMQPGEEVRFCLRGDLGHALVCVDDRLLILKGGFHAGTTFGAMAATIYYEDVTGIQLRMHLVSGWIEISSPSFQGRERKHTRHPRSSDRDVYKLPNCVPINRRHVEAYRAPLAELRRLVAAAKRRHPHAGVVTELERLAALRQDGLLDEAEFAAAKARILAGTPIDDAA
ncbi:MAG TPA: SHOCT domain-containing protein [Gaiellaceae bacterium]|nr:SHOCT domain-containing protein [Gaiellaceae bacterium]